MLQEEVSGPGRGGGACKNSEQASDRREAIWPAGGSGSKVKGGVRDQSLRVDAVAAETRLSNSCRRDLLGSEDTSSWRGDGTEGPESAGIKL